MMASLRQIIAVLLLTCYPSTSVALIVNPGYDVYAAAQVMIDKASHSWEWGTASEALLELYNNDVSVFGSNPFPNGKVPSASPGIFSLKYAKQYIHVNSQVLAPNSAAGDPASLGVAAIMLGQSDGKYLDAADRQADYLLNQVPKWSNGAISHRPDVAEIWADNMFMSFPFLAYQAVQKGDASLMAEVVKQCGLQRDVLKTSQYNSWRHIIGPQSQDTGLWATGNGWAAYGMVRVLATLQKWSGSASMTSQANQLKGWIQEILTGALASNLDGGLLRNYVNDQSWFGEISGTAMLAAVAYRMAANDPAMFPQKYIDWADARRVALANYQGSDGVFSPAVNPYGWTDRNKYTKGSPEGQAFSVFLYTAYRDCISSKVCSPPPPASTISKPGIGPTDIMTMLHAPVTFSAMPEPTDVPCGTPQSCDANGCAGGFQGLTKYPVCKAGSKLGCRCIATSNTCGAHQSCDLNGCAGSFDGLKAYAQCTGNFEGCECTATDNTCGPRQSCDLNGCAGSFDGQQKYPQCTNNFKGCKCQATGNTCGSPQSCDLNNCAGHFDLGNGKAYCSNNFVGCECAATSKTCGNRQSCDLNNCQGGFSGNVPYPQCKNFFKGCECQATGNTCGAPQSCGLNGCAGSFDLHNGKAYCSSNFVGCECQATPATCGKPQSCDLNNCQGSFGGSVPSAQCTNFFKGCACKATDNTCGAPQSCDLNGCAGGYDSSGVARCQNNFQGCKCKATSATCGTPQRCDLNGCNGSFDSKSNTARCRGNFAGCVCIPVPATCGSPQSCSLNGCNGGYNGNGDAICLGNFYGCPCNPGPIWIPPPPQLPRPQDDCAVAHCFLQNSAIEGDIMTVQFYAGSGSAATEYTFVLSDGKYGASANTVWVWDNIRDSHGVTWRIQVDGNCGAITYENSVAGGRGPTVTLDHAKQPVNVYTCGSLRCTQYESTYWGSVCAAGQNPSFCDYRATCNAWRGGNPVIVRGGS
ncbi:Six-hairpin glycosidase-like protein [Trichoderma barbatum]